MDQRIGEYETWDDLKWYCVHSADPCGRLVLGVLRRLDDPELVDASDSVCTGLQLVNFLQDVPRDLELGRIYLPAEDRRRFGDPALDRPSDELRALLRFEANRAAGLLAAGETAPRADRRPPRPRRRPVRPRRPGRAGRARVGRLGHLHEATEAVAGAPRPRGGADAGAMNVDDAYAEVVRVTRARAKNFAYGIMVLPRPKRYAIAAVYAFAREVDDVADGPLPLDEKRTRLEALRARTRRHRPAGGDARRARGRPCPLRDPARRAVRARRRRAPGHRADAIRGLRRSPRLLREGRGCGRRRVRRRLRLRRHGPRAHARRRAAADQHPPRRRARTGSWIASTCRRTSLPGSACPRPTSRRGARRPSGGR